MSVACPVLVGREEERAALASAVEALASGVGGCLCIAGEAGIGKSRLLSEALQLARERGCGVLEVQCFERDRSVPFAPLEDLSAIRQVLDREWGIPDAEPSLNRLRMVRAVLARLNELAAERPLLLSVEDLHWADERTLELIGRLARQTPQMPILLLVTYRADETSLELSELVSSLRRGRVLRELVLRPLGEREIAAMVQAILGPEHPVRPGVLERIGSVADGNPLIVEEVLSALLEAGEVELRDGRWDRRPRDGVRVASDLQHAVDRRIDKLSDGARELLELAAMTGRRFDFVLLQALTQESEDTLVQQLKELVAQRLVIEERPDQFAFRHALTRDAVGSRLLARERRRLHQRIAECLEKLRPSTGEAALEDLAYHFFEAHQWRSALDYARRAADRATELHTPRAAIEDLSRGIGAAEHLSDPVLLELLRTRCSAYELVGDLERARADAEHALRLAQVRGDVGVECQVRLELGFVYAAFDFSRAGQEFGRALDLARSVGDPLLLGRSLNRVGNWYVNVGDPAAGLRLHLEALELFEARSDWRGSAETLDLLGLAAFHTGDARLAAEYYQRAREAFSELDDKRGQASSLAMLSQLGAIATFGTEAGPGYGPQEAIGDAQSAVALAQASGWRAGETFALAGLSMALMASGSIAPALEAAHRCVALAEELEHQQWIAMGRLVLGAGYFGLLALPLAQAELERSRATAVSSGSAIFEQQAAALLGRVLVEQGDLAAAEATLKGYLGDEGPPPHGMRRMIWLSWAHLRLARGEADTALQVVDQLLGTQRVVIPEVWLTRAAALALVERLAEAEAAARAVLERAEAQGLQMLALRAEAQLSRVLRRERRGLEAAALADSATARGVALASGVPDTPEPLLGGVSLRANFLAAVARFLPSRRTPTPLRAARQRYAGLTAREREVALLLAQGRTNPEIAADLVVGQRTAQTHVANILRKLGCSSRAQVAVWVERHGLMRDHTP